MIYFIKCHCSIGYIKIGYTSGGTARVNGLQTATPYQVTLLKIIRGDQTAERAMHRRFAHLHERGEWFRPGPDLVEYVSGLENETEPPATAEDREKMAMRLAMRVGEMKLRDSIRDNWATERRRWL
jgi:hypothetical protein